MSKSNSDRIWERFLVLYRLLTDCEKGQMSWQKPLPVAVLKQRTALIDHELENIYRIARRRWRGRHNATETSKARWLAHLSEEGSDINDPAELARCLVGDTFYYSDRCNNERARRLLHMWEQFKSL